MNSHKTPIKLSKYHLSEATTIGQFSEKFIAIIAPSNYQLDEKNSELLAPNLNKPLTELDRLIIIIDQHAAHERILLEELISRFRNCSKLPGTVLPNKYAISMNSQSLSTIMNNNSLELLANLGFSVEADTEANYLYISGVPRLLTREAKLCIPHRELVNLVKTILNYDKDENNHTQNLEVKNANLLVCDSGVTKIPISCGWMAILQTKACHSAIRFGDILTLDECFSLINSLAKCHLPFQCAHGRPAAVPTIRLTQSANRYYTYGNKPNYKKLRNYNKIR